MSFKTQLESAVSRQISDYKESNTIALGALNIKNSLQEEYDALCLALLAAIKLPDMEELRQRAVIIDDLDKDEWGIDGPKAEKVKQLEKDEEEIKGSFIKAKEHKIALFLKNCIDALEKEAQQLDQVNDIPALDEKERAIDAILNLISACQTFIDAYKHLSIFADFTALEKKKITIKNSIQQRRSTLQSAENRKVFQDKFTQQIKKYCQKRNENYRLKDWLSLQDRTLRESFTQQLMDKIKVFMADGNKADLLTFVQEKKKDFPGLNLQALLNRFILELKELNEPVPASQNAFDMRLAGLDQSFLNSAILCLLGEIEGLDNYGKTLAADEQKIVCDLAAELKICLLQFQAALQQKSWQEFKTDFVLRLHTYDDGLSCHQSFWPRFLLNVAWVLCSLGVGLWIKSEFFSSKSEPISNRYFFWPKTPAMKAIAAIETQVNNLESNRSILNN